MRLSLQKRWRDKRSDTGILEANQKLGMQERPNTQWQPTAPAK